MGRVVSLYKVTSRGEVRPEGGPLAPDLRTFWGWFFREVLDNPLMQFARKTRYEYQRCRDITLDLLDLGPNQHPSNYDILRLANAMRGQLKLSSNTVRHHVRSLHAAYKYGNDAGRDVVSGNPCAFIAMERPEPRPHIIPNIVEVLPVLLDTLPDDRARAFVLCERFIGRRRGEVIGLRRDSFIRESADVWRIDVTHQRANPNCWDLSPLKNRGGGERSIPVRRGRHPLFPVLEELARLGPARVRVGKGGKGGEVEAPGGLVFPYREHDLGKFMRGFRAVMPLAFPPGRAWHVFRHTLAVELNRKGKGDDDVCEALGHSSTYVTRMTYMGVWGKRVRESVFDGVWSTAPPGVTAVEKRPAGASTPAGQRRSKASSPPTKEERSRCSTPGRSGQKALPGLAVGPVVRKPRK